MPALSVACLVFSDAVTLVSSAYFVISVSSTFASRRVFVAIRVQVVLLSALSPIAVDSVVKS